MSDSPRQLQMRLPTLEGLPEPRPPAGTELRTYLPGDEAHWARIMNECIGENWTPERCLEELVRRPQFRPDACFFAIVGGVPQGTATAWLHPAYLPDRGYLHMIGVASEQRGRGLGTLVTLAALGWFREHGFAGAVLDTDDWRLPAIAVYLKLGFGPVLFDDEHARRWTAVRASLEEGSPAPDAAEAGPTH